jgi:4-amino-4-deoxy-L-arabinose transferase-like glycosyltransferase
MKKTPAILGLIALTLAVRIPLWDVPLERDEGGYALIASEWLEGNPPYKGMVDPKPPLLFAWFMPVAKISGGNPALVHACGYLWHAGTVLVFWRLALLLFSFRAALAAAAVYAIASADPTAQGFAVNGEVVMLLPALASLYLLWRAAKSGSPRLALLSGALLASGALAKQQAVPQFLLFILPWLLPARKRAKVAASFLAGGIAVFLLCAAFLATQGLLAAALSLVAYGTQNIIAAVPPLASLKRWGPLLGQAAVTEGWVWLLAFAGFAAGRWQDKPARRIVLAWFAVSILQALMGRRPAPHYLQHLLPPLALATGAFFARMQDRRPPASARAALAAAVLLLIVSTGHLLPLLAATREVKALSLYPGNSFLAGESAGRWLGKYTDPGSRIFIAGSEPQILFAAGRRPAGRIPYIWPLSVPGPFAEKESAAWTGNIRRNDISAVVYCPDRTSWEDAYTDPKMAENLRHSVLKTLEEGGWRVRATFPPVTIYTRE